MSPLRIAAARAAAGRRVRRARRAWRVSAWLALAAALAAPLAWSQSGDFYGPVERGETLWGIADALRPHRNVTVPQAMVAIYHANRSAFDGNMLRMKQGVVLKVPSYAAMRAVPRALASQEMERQRLLERTGRIDQQAPGNLSRPAPARASPPARPSPARPRAAPPASRPPDDRPLPPLTSDRLLTLNSDAVPAPQVVPAAPNAGSLADLLPGATGEEARLLASLRRGLDAASAWFDEWFDELLSGDEAKTAKTAERTDWLQTARDPKVLFSAVAVIVVVVLLGLLALPPRQLADRALDDPAEYDEDIDDADLRSPAGLPGGLAAGPARYRDTAPGGAPPSMDKTPPAPADYASADYAPTDYAPTDYAPPGYAPADEAPALAPSAHPPPESEVYWNGESMPAAWRLEAEGEVVADEEMARRHREIDAQLDQAENYLRLAQDLLDRADADAARTEEQKQRASRLRQG